MTADIRRIMANARKKRQINIPISRQDELIREIKYLRSVAKDVVDRYSLKINAHLADLVRILESPNRKRYTSRKPKDKVMREMLSCARSLNVKPKKGRAKDLARIEKIANDLADLMPSQP